MARFTFVLSLLAAASPLATASGSSKQNNLRLNSEEQVLLSKSEDVPSFTHPMPKAFCFGEEKGARCMGHYKDEKGEMKCEAGMRKNFTASFKATDMMTNVAEALHQELLPQVLPDQDFFVPNDPMVLNDIMLLEETMKKTGEQPQGEFDDNLMSSLLQAGKCDKDGCHMAFEGKATLEYGCKMSFGMKDGKVTKSVACGMKGVSSAGKKEQNSDEDAEDTMVAAEDFVFEMA